MQGDFTSIIQSKMAELPLTMRRVALYFDQNRTEVISRSASELARAINTSDASVIRTAKALGYRGLPELRRSLADQMAEATPAEGFDRTMRAANADARRAADQILGLQQRQLAELNNPEQIDALMAVVAILNKADRIVPFGIGPTAHLIGYLCHLLGRHGRDTFRLDGTGSDLADQLLSLCKGDAVLAFSYGRSYAEIEVVMSEAAGLGLPVLLVTDNPAGRLLRQAETVVRVPRGDGRGIALHGTTMIWIETLVVALSSLRSNETSRSLQRLSRLREAL